MTAIIKSVTHSDVDEQRADWRYRAVEATQGNQTLMGMTLLAILGKRPRHPPFLGKTAVIEENGLMTVDAMTAEGRWVKGGNLGHVQVFIDSLRGLCDHLEFSDVDRAELFSEARKWISLDNRQVGGQVNTHGELEAPEI